MKLVLHHLGLILALDPKNHVKILYLMVKTVETIFSSYVHSFQVGLIIES